MQRKAHEIRYQLCIQCYTEWGVTDKDSVKVSGVKIGRF